jgi:biopolymer transport protein TolQ
VDNFNIITMFLQAGLVVQLVMLLLLIFSIVSWFIVFRKYMLFRSSRLESTDFLNFFWKSKNLAEAYRSTREDAACPEAHIFISGYGELLKLSRHLNRPKGEETLEMRLTNMDNLKRALERAQNLEMERLGRSLSFLATTGSATPFIGLFGTVWGIMGSFHDIGIRGSASLAVVAPGISEALVATAAGLAVAIPAVVFYNHYANQLADMENNMSRFIADFLNLVERDLLLRRTDSPKQGELR